MTADHDQVGDFKSAPQRPHSDLLAGFKNLGVSAYGHEAVGSTECGDGTRAFSHRVCGEAVVGCYQADEQILSSADFGICFNPHAGFDCLMLLEPPPGKGADHGRDEFMERKYRGSWKSGEDYDWFAAAYRQTNRLTGLKRHTMSDYSW